MLPLHRGLGSQRIRLSPDRVDALVWAMTDLFPGMTERARPGAVCNPEKRGWMR